MDVFGAAGLLKLGGLGIMSHDKISHAPHHTWYAPGERVEASEWYERKKKQWSVDGGQYNLFDLCIPSVESLMRRVVV